MTEHHFAAAAMRQRAIEVRLWLVANYFAPSLDADKQVPLSDLIRQSGIRPIEDYQLRLLLNRPPLLLRSGVLQGRGIAVACHFALLINGQDHRIKVTFPQFLEGTYEVGPDGLQLRFTKDVLIQFPEDDQIAGISGVLTLIAIGMTDKTLSYLLRSVGSGQTIQIVLDLDRGERATIGPIPKRSERMWTFVAAGTSCSCNGYIANKDAWYVLRDCSGTRVQRLIAGTTVDCSQGHGPFDTQQQAEADERTWGFAGHASEARGD